MLGKWSPLKTKEKSGCYWIYKYIYRYCIGYNL